MITTTNTTTTTSTTTTTVTAYILFATMIATDLVTLKLFYYIKSKTLKFFSVIWSYHLSFILNHSLNIRTSSLRTTTPPLH